jgi:hypothetical protein
MNVKYVEYIIRSSEWTDEAQETLTRVSTHIQVRYCLVKSHSQRDSEGSCVMIFRRLTLPYLLCCGVGRVLLSWSNCGPEAGGGPQRPVGLRKSGLLGAAGVAHGLSGARRDDDATGECVILLTGAIRRVRCHYIRQGLCHDFHAHD